MTFPRRLTPSDKERATIVQQRMTPGSALGVGSRHVRSGEQRPPGGSNGSAGGVIGRAEFYDTGDRKTIGGLGTVSNGPLALLNTFGDTSSIELSGGFNTWVLPTEDGWFSVVLIVLIDSAIFGDKLQTTLFTGGDDDYAATTVAGLNGTGYMSVASIPLYRAVADDPNFSFSISNEANRGTIAQAKLSVVRLAG